MASSSRSSGPKSNVITSNMENKPIITEKQVIENLDKEIAKVETEVPGEFDGSEYRGEYDGEDSSAYMEYPGEYGEELGEAEYSKEFISEPDSQSKVAVKESFGEDRGEGEDSKEDVYIPRELALTEDEKAEVKNHWGFLEFDIVLYTRGNYQYLWLKRGDPIFTVDYAHKLYFFLSQANREAFMKRPRYYIDNAPLPLKTPPKFKPVPPEMVPAGGLLITSGTAEELTKSMVMLLKKKPRFPFTSLKRSGLLYMAYHLKSKDMTLSPELRAHYRNAMLHMTKTQEAAQKLCADVNKYHGREDEMPEDLKDQLETFIKLSHLPDNKKLVDPHIEDFEFNYESIPVSDKYDEEEDGEANEETMSILSKKESVRGEQWSEVEVMGEAEEAVKNSGKTGNKPDEPPIDLGKYSLPPYAGKYRMYK